MRRKGEERREWILQTLQSQDLAVKGADLAEQAEVSRQVIVNDINLLKVAGHPIVATSQGYILLGSSTVERIQERIVCNHLPENTLDELQTVVDHGVTVEDVTVEHPVYGEISAKLMVSNRSEVMSFMSRMQKHDAPLLLEITGGTHLHTISADSEDKLVAAKKALREKGYLIEN